METRNQQSLASGNKPLQSAFSLGSEGEPVEGVFTVERVTFANPESGYAVVHLAPVEGEASGSVASNGNLWRGAGWDVLSSAGHLASRSALWRPDTRLLRDHRNTHDTRGGGTLPGRCQHQGAGPHHARLIVEHFGTDVIAVLDQGGNRLEEVRGIGPVRAAKIRTSWSEHQTINRLMVNLQGIAGITPRQAQRIYREFGDDAWQAVSTNPYLLAERMNGFGFRTCDRIAGSLGVNPWHRNVSKLASCTF